MLVHDPDLPISLTVSELSRAVAHTLMANFALGWVSGELSSLTRAASGHWYFTLKDDGAQVRCVMYRQRACLLDFLPKEGDTLLVRAQVSFYEPRGEFQLQVENIRKAGLGALYEAFLRVKAKLQTEGLLDESRKLTLPRYPLRVGVVTSLQAAALADVVRAFSRRAPHVQLVVYPCLVQGDAAVAQIVVAIAAAQRRQEVDVLLLVRGGGSLEDLWCFNHEAVARAIANCTIPTISGVGHETDTTIADLVADVRAATPTAAAELASQATADLLSLLGQSAHKIKQCLMRQFDTAQQQLKHTSQYMRRQIDQALSARLSDLNRQQAMLPQAVRRCLHVHQQRCESASKYLQLLSPQRVLERGYALVTHMDGRVVSDATTIEPESLLQVKLSHGALEVLVRKIDAKQPFERN